MITYKTCPVCGNRFVGESKQHYCSIPCREVHAKAHRLEKYKQQKALQPAPEKTKSLEDINAEARAAGLTYGQYQAMELARKYARVEV